MSSVTRQSYTRSDVELHSTTLYAVLGPVSSHTRKPFLLDQVQCRVTPDSPFFCTRSNVELHSTAPVPGPMSSYNRQLFCTRSNVELKSTRYLVYHVLRSSELLRSNGCVWNPNTNRFSGKIWTRLSELTVTNWTAKWRSCWLSQNLEAERGNEECGILSLRNQFKYSRTQCR